MRRIMQRAPLRTALAEDLEIWSGAIRDALDRGHDGDSFAWKNPATFERPGMSCRGAEFTHTAGGETSRTAWNLCRTPQGWKLAEGR